MKILDYVYGETYDEYVHPSKDIFGGKKFNSKLLLWSAKIVIIESINKCMDKMIKQKNLKTIFIIFARIIKSSSLEIFKTIVYTPFQNRKRSKIGR